MAQIVFQFSAQHDIGSEVIQTFERGLYSHVDIVLPDSSLLGARDDELAGIAAGVQVRPTNYATFSATKRVVIECTQDQEDAFLTFARSQIGKPYDETAIYGFVFDRDWTAKDSWYCSELGAASLQASGILLHKLATTTNKITPEDLLLVCSVLTEVS